MDYVGCVDYGGVEWVGVEDVDVVWVVYEDVGVEFCEFGYLGKVVFVDFVLEVDCVGGVGVECDY